MRLAFAAALLLCLAPLSGLLHAQECGAGYYNAVVTNPGQQASVINCVPIPGYQQQQQEPQPAQLQWESRWGAIATDAARGVIGSAANMTSKDLAGQFAMTDCKNNGGTNCLMQGTFFNGCGTLIAGDKTFNVSWGATESIASQVGLKTCNADDTNCSVYFKTCSPAVRVR
jgi:hypothetical protein